MRKSPSRIKFRNLPSSGFKKQQKASVRALEKIASSTQDQTPNTKSRLFVVWGVLVAAGLGLAVNLYQLQIVSGPKLTQKARNQQMVNLRPFMPRRPVIDRTNNVLAIDRPVYTVYAHPKLFNKSGSDIANELAPILDKDAADLEKVFQSKKSGILLSSALPEELADHISSMHLDGLELIQKYSRLYPQQVVLCIFVSC